METMEYTGIFLFQSTKYFLVAIEYNVIDIESDLSDLSM